MRFPDFYCVGVQKAGTTWLHRQLSLHSKIWLMPNALKELQYFNEIYVDGHKNWTGQHRADGFKRLIELELNNEGNCNFDVIRQLSELASMPVNDSWYSKVFEMAECNQLIGDITPEYSMLPEAGIRHMLSLNERAKFILILRHPVDRDYSHIRMIIKNKYGSQLQGFTDNILEQHLLSAADHKGVAERSYYKQILARFESLIPGENIHIAFYDDIVDLPIETLNSICDFLDLDVEDSIYEKAQSASFKGPEIELPNALKEKLFERHVDEIKYINDRFGKNWRES